MIFGRKKAQKTQKERNGLEGMVVSAEQAPRLNGGPLNTLSTGGHFHFFGLFVPFCGCFLCGVKQIRRFRLGN
jgi:hypothetical protein